METKLFLNKHIKLWEKENGYFHQGMVAAVDDNGLTMIDRKDGLTYISKEKIEKIEEVKNGN